MKYKLLHSITIFDEDTFNIKIIPEGIILKEAWGGGLYECLDPVMCVGKTWIKNNPHIFEEVK